MILNTVAASVLQAQVRNLFVFKSVKCTDHDKYLSIFPYLFSINVGLCLTDLNYRGTSVEAWKATLTDIFILHVTYHIGVASEGNPPPSRLLSLTLHLHLSVILHLQMHIFYEMDRFIAPSIIDRMTEESKIGSIRKRKRFLLKIKLWKKTCQNKASFRPCHFWLKKVNELDLQHCVVYI